jgi:hypothetical protein
MCRELDRLSDAMNKPRWEIFRSRDNQETVFERDVARRLFCHEVGVEPAFLTCPPNYPGIENIPIESADGWVAFQAKHSLNGSQNGDAFESLRKIIKPVQDGDFQLNKIYCFSSGVAPSTPTAQTAEQRRIVSDLSTVGIVVEWYYSDRILTILEDATDPNLVRASQAFFEDLPQPYLDQQKGTANPVGFRRLRFNERLSEFAGRQTELEQLDQFTNTDKNFCWWLVTGPGLSGKSRLLLEHCRSLENWHWGWLESDLEDFTFSDWIPDQDTFIVVDYVLGREHQLQRLFQQIQSASRSDRFVHKVRLILLEREYSGWLREVEHAPGIGNWIAESKFRQDGLTIERIPKVLAAIEDFPPGQFMEAIGELLHREEQRRWQDVPQVAFEALVLATASGGFSLEELTGPFRPETKSYFDQLNYSESVAKMIGVEHSPNYYPPLQPDVFGELYVLDAIQKANPSARKDIFQRAYELNASGLVNFLYRCAQSFPEHPALGNALSDWSYDQRSRLAYLAIFANGLDSGAFTAESRLDTYRKIMEELSAPSGNLFFIERAIFGKLLALFPENNLQIVPIEIRLRDQVEIVAEPQDSEKPNPDILSSLFPEDYCNAVSDTWRQLDDKNKLTLLGPHLVEIFHHQILRSLEVRPRHLEVAQALFSELVHALELSNGDRYAATILNFHGLCANVIAALVQFSHRSAEAMDWADEIGRKANSLSTLKREGRWMVFVSSNLDRIDMGLTVMVAYFYHRDYQYKLQRIEAIRQRGAGIQSNEPLKMLTYVQAAVAASSGFNGNDEAREARTVLERCREYTAIVDTPEIAGSFAMILVNLTDFATSYDLGQTSLSFFVEAGELARQYPEPQHRIIDLILRKLSTFFDNQVKNDDLEAAKQSMMLARSMIESANTVHYEDTRRLYTGFFDSLLFRFVTGQPTLFGEAKEMARFLSSSPAVNWKEIMSNIGALSRYFSEAQRAINGGDRSRAERALLVLEFYSNTDPTNDYSQVISIIQEQLNT